MADIDHPKTHVENQENVEEPRTQPESPKHEGIDPLTESDTMYGAEDVKTKSAKLAKKGTTDGEETAQEYSDRSAALVGAQEEREANLPNHEFEGGDGSGRLTDEETNVNADGKLSKADQIANGVGSDKGNTSPSNKPATVNAPKKGATETKS